MRDTFPGLDRANHGLRPVRVDTALRIRVRVPRRAIRRRSRRPGARSREELAPYRFEEMVPLAPITTDVWNVDWKIAMDNYLESYHVPIGHPGLYRHVHAGLRGPAPRCRAWPAASAGCASSPRPRWSERLYQSLIGKAAAHLPEKLRRCWRFYSALPNLGIDVFPDQMDFFQLLPGGPGKCIVRGATFGLPGTQRRAARRALPEQPHQHARSTTRTSGCASACSAGSPRAATSRGRCRRSRAACSSSTICCASAFRSSGCLRRRSSSPSTKRKNGSSNRSAHRIGCCKSVVPGRRSSSVANAEDIRDDDPQAAGDGKWPRVVATRRRAVLRPPSLLATPRRMQLSQTPKSVSVRHDVGPRRPG